MPGSQPSVRPGIPHLVCEERRATFAGAVAERKTKVPFSWGRVGMCVRGVGAGQGLGRAVCCCPWLERGFVA